MLSWLIYLNFGAIEIIDLFTDLLNQLWIHVDIAVSDCLLF